MSRARPLAALLLVASCARGDREPDLIEDDAQAWAGGLLDPSDPVLESSFASDEHVRWYWGGCTTFVAALDDGDRKELLLFDGYVSKDALGLVDFTVSDEGIGRVERYADFIGGFLDEGYTISGMLVTHSHADHVGDIPLLLHYLKERLDYRPFPIVTDWATRVDACGPLDLFLHFDPFEFAEILPFEELVTHVLVYETDGVLPDAGVVTACLDGEATAEEEASISPFGKPYSRDYAVYDIAAGDYTSVNELTLGSFGADAFLMDHAGIPTVPAEYRVNAFQVWDTERPDQGRVLLLDTTDLGDFVPDTIETDHLFLTWVPETFQSFDDYLLFNDRTATATLVASAVRFSPGGPHFVVPMHVDDITGLAYTTEDVANAELRATARHVYEAVWPYSLTAFSMSEDTLESRLPEDGIYAQIWPTPHVGWLLPDDAPWEASPLTYTTEEQGDVELRFALWGWRMGD